MNRPLDSRPGTEKVLDSPTNLRIFADLPDDRGHSKTAPKASIIPKNWTGSGRTKGNLGRDKFEVDAFSSGEKAARTEKMKTFGHLILETRKAAD